MTCMNFGLVGIGRSRYKLSEAGPTLYMGVWVACLKCMLYVHIREIVHVLCTYVSMKGWKNLILSTRGTVPAVNLKIAIW